MLLVPGAKPKLLERTKLRPIACMTRRVRIYSFFVGCTHTVTFGATAGAEPAPALFALTAAILAAFLNLLLLGFAILIFSFMNLLLFYKVFSILIF